MRIAEHWPPVRAATVFVAGSAVHDAIVGLKYHNRRARASELGELLADAIIAAADGPFDVVTWAPTSSAHRRRRGFDQAEMIARAVARRMNVPARALLRRRGAVAQTGRSRRQRLAGPTFIARRGAGGLRVLVIDDVTTTGATLRAAQRAFRTVGAELVACWAVAATPAR